MRVLLCEAFSWRMIVAVVIDRLSPDAIRVLSIGIKCEDHTLPNPNLDVWSQRLYADPTSFEHVISILSTISMRKFNSSKTQWNLIKTVSITIRFPLCAPSHCHWRAIKGHAANWNQQWISKHFTSVMNHYFAHSISFRLHFFLIRNVNKLLKIFKKQRRPVKR